MYHQDQCMVERVRQCQQIWSSMKPKNLQVERQVMQLWDYDSIGIREQNEVHEYLLDNIEFTGERYRVRLPWKIGHPFLPDNHNLSFGRLKSQLRRLKNEPNVLREYDKIIHDQEKEGIVEKLEMKKAQ